MKIFAKIILKLWGWKIHGIIPQNLKKCIIMAAPHTSNLDFFVGRLAYAAIGVDIKFLIKKELFIFPIGGILRTWGGGIAVDRGKRTNVVEQIVAIFDNADSIYVMITPEGTRKYSARWKKGFYLISEKANVPIALGYADYAKKEAGVGPVIYPTGDYEADLKIIQDFYRDKTARHPENFNLTPKKEDES
ncbi:MAG: acyltransferase [Bacteroidetes bacterium]|nr:acyltransferase [Bacteroidota bacterium]